MLLIFIGYLIVGIVLIFRGDRILQKALECDDEEEKAALEALGNKTRRNGKIVLGMSIVLIIGVLIMFVLLGMEFI